MVPINIAQEDTPGALLKYRASDLTMTESSNVDNTNTNNKQLSSSTSLKGQEDGQQNTASVVTATPSSEDTDNIIGNNLQTQEELEDGLLYGWVIVFASFVAQMTTQGFLNTYGVFQHYYLTEAFKGTATAFQLSWIASLVNTSMDLVGPLTGSICDTFGHSPAALLGVAIMSFALILAAFATQVWHLQLAQGLLYGLGTSLTFFAAMTLPAQWFTKRRGLATGIMFSGGGVGGLWMAPV
ncbi:hypothetical protein BGW39_008613, partial [Mortierella sp. 14UC]